MPSRPVQLKGHGVVAVMENAGRYLMIQRAQHLKAGGWWCFVGGAVEDGETQQQALVREVREEVGMNVTPGQKVWQCLSFNGEWLLHCWTATPESLDMRLNPREVLDARWMSVREIADCAEVLPSVLDYLREKRLL